MGVVDGLAERPVRLFIAIDLDERARDVVAGAIERLTLAGLHARFIPRENWHVTVAFLGATPPSRIDDVALSLTSAAAACAPFDITLDCIGAFPTRSRPRIVWVGSSIPQPAFAACATTVRTALAAIGFTFEVDAIPHVTVCRLKDRGARLPDVRIERTAVVHVRGLTLYESVPAGPTTRYVARSAFAFE